MSKGALDGTAKILRSSRLVLSRPDQHVAWRGDSIRSDPLALIDQVAVTQLGEARLETNTAGRNAIG